jgi:hypothetical protein
VAGPTESDHQQSQAELQYVERVRAEIRLHYLNKQLRRYRIARLVVIVSAALVPVLAAATVVPRVALGALGAIAAVTEAIHQTFQFQRTGIEAMRTANALERELNRFMMSVGPYGTGDAIVSFVTQIESIREDADRAFYNTWRSPPTAVRALPAGPGDSSPGE